MLICNPTKFWRRYSTVDGTWIHHTLETKQQSKEWVSTGQRSDGQQRHGHSFLGFARCHLHRKGWNYPQWILFTGTGQVWHYFEAKPTAFSEQKNVVSSGQCSSAYVCSHHGKIHASYSLDSPPLRLFSAFKPQRVVSDLSRMNSWFAYFESLGKSYYSEGIKKYINIWFFFRIKYFFLITKFENIPK